MRAVDLDELHLGFLEGTTFRWCSERYHITFKWVRVACGVDGNRSITPLAASSSAKSKLSPPIWQTELHTKLWGKRQFFDDTFRTVTLTKADFIGLQQQLHGHDPERNSDGYVAQDVLTINADFLRTRSSADSTASSSHLTQLPMTTSSGSWFLAPPMMSCPYILTSVREMRMTPWTPLPRMQLPCMLTPWTLFLIPTHTLKKMQFTFLQNTDTAIFPCTIRYMDLGALELTHFTRIPEIILFRNEWGNMVYLTREKRAIRLRGGAVFIGQPGIWWVLLLLWVVLSNWRTNLQKGKTCLLYHILILCVIRARPFIFQDIGGDVFIVRDEGECLNKRTSISGDDVLVLVDADGEICIPHFYLLDPSNLRVLLTSSSRRRKDDVGSLNLLFVMEPWLPKKFLVASFVYSSDLIYSEIYFCLIRFRLFLAHFRQLFMYVGIILVDHDLIRFPLLSFWTLPNISS